MNKDILKLMQTQLPKPDLQHHSEEPGERLFTELSQKSYSPSGGHRLSTLDDNEEDAADLFRQINSDKKNDLVSARSSLLSY